MTERLSEILTEELTRPAPPEARAFADDIRRRHGDAVAAVLFYGSCLRTRNMDGVLDFYVLVDSYRAVFTSRVLAWLNALLPPNVFYAEVRFGDTTIRGKYAVISMQDFLSAATPPSLYAIIWGRFCQPALLVYRRDQASQATVIRACTEAALTMVGRMTALLPAERVTSPAERVASPAKRIVSKDLWQTGFQETYRTELRAEQAETIQNIYLFAPERYDTVADAALRELEQRGTLQLASEQADTVPDNVLGSREDTGKAWQVTIPTQQRRWQQWDWRLRRPAAKARYALWLLKSAATFHNWLPYVMWKISRHAGVTLTPTAQQLRHPVLLGGPALLKLLWRQNLR